MSVRINTIGQGAAWDDYGASLDGATVLTAAVTVQIGASFVDSFVFAKWAFLDGDRVFAIIIFATGQVAFYVRGTGGYKARETTNTPVTVNSTMRIACRWQAAGNTITIAVNGVDCPLTIRDGHDSAVTALQTSAATISIGKPNLPDVSGCVGAYSELGLWTSDVGATIALALTDPDNPDAPVAYTSTLFFYVPLCRNSVGNPNPEPYFKNLIDSLDAGLYVLDQYPDGTDDHPWVVYPDPSAYDAGFCAVSNPATTEVEPGIGESFGPLVWVEWESTDGTERVWAPVDLPDPTSYYLGYKSPFLLSAGRVVRALSDEQGEYQGQTFDVTVNDISRDLRTLLGTSDSRRHLLNTRGVMRMISQEDWRARLVPRTVAIGKLRNYKLH